MQGSPGRQSASSKQGAPEARQVPGTAGTAKQARPGGHSPRHSGAPTAPQRSPPLGVHRQPPKPEISGTHSSPGAQAPSHIGAMVPGSTQGSTSGRQVQPWPISLQPSPGGQSPLQVGGVTPGSSQGSAGGRVVVVGDRVVVVVLLVVVEAQQSWQSMAAGKSPTAFCRTMSASTADTVASLLTSPQG